MAIGFTPRHSETMGLGTLSAEDFLVVAHEALSTLGWPVSHNSRSGLIAYTNNGTFSRNFEIKLVIEDGMAMIQSSSIGNEMMDWGKNKKLVGHLISKINELKESLPDETLKNKYAVLKEGFIPDEEDVLKLPPATASEQVKEFLSFFKPQKDFFITPVLLDLNILIFILMAFSGVNILLPGNESLLNWGANFRPLTLDGQWWRLITNCFLHIGIIHLLFNMYALVYIGMLLEPILGRTRFISAYLLTGFAASVASLWWHNLTISAGASGAIFGMYGVFLALLTTDLIEKTARKPLLASIAVFVGYNLIFGLKGGIDNAAHIGGLVSGLVIGYGLLLSLKKSDVSSLKYASVGMLTLLIVIPSSMVYTNIPNDIGAYDKKMEQFVILEEKALDVYHLPENTSNEKILYALKENGINNWQQSIAIIDGCKNMDLPVEIKRRNQLLLDYCKLRIKSYEALYKAISENTEIYKAQIEDYNLQIEKKINELNNK